MLPSLLSLGHHQAQTRSEGTVEVNGRQGLERLNFPEKQKLGLRFISLDLSEFIKFRIRGNNQRMSTIA